MQGTIVFLIGISVLFDLAIEFICTDASPTQRNPRTAFVSIVLLPAFWLLLASTAVSSKSYYCTDMPCIAKHFLYPVLVTLRNPDIWRALLVFGSAMGSALAVLFTFWCMLLSLAAIAMIMLQGSFQTQDYATDNQFFDFYTAFTTMFIYVDSADNYTSTADIANEIGIFQMLYFLFCTLAGAFFITALLIDVFCGSYDEDQADALKFVHSQSSYCDAAVVVIWGRHCNYAQALVKLQRNDSEIQVSCEQGLSFDSFLDLVFSGCIVENDVVMHECKSLITTIVEKLEARRESRGSAQTVTVAEHRIVRELLDICAETSLTDLFDKLHSLTEHPDIMIAGNTTETKVSITDWRVLQLLSMGVEPTVMAGISWDEVQWARGRTPSDADLKVAVAVLPRLKGLVEPSLEDNGQLEWELYNLTCRVLRLEYLRKWCVHRIFTSLDKSEDGMIDPSEFHLLWPMVQTMTKMASGKRIRAEGYLMGILAEMDKLRTSLLNDVECEESELERIMSTFQTIQTGESGLIQIRQLAEVREVFGRYADKAVDGIRLPQLPEALLEGIFKWKNEDYMQSCATQMASEWAHHRSPHELTSVFAPDNQLDNEQAANEQVVSLDEFNRLRQRLSNVCLEQQLGTMSETEHALLLLTREHAHLIEHQKIMSRGFGTCEALLYCLFQGAAWSNVLVMSLYYTAESTTTLDWLMVILASLPWIEQMHLWCVGFDTDGGTIMCLVVSLFGLVSMLVHDEFKLLPMGTARFLTGFSTVTLFTKNMRFTQLMTTASTMGQLAWPLVGSLIAVTSLYALAAREIFKDNALDETTSPFFDTYSTSLSTFFRLFVAEGWTDIMYSGTDATNTSARLFFMSYILLATLLFAQLTIGWVVSVFGLVQKIGSEKVYRFLLQFVASGA